MKRLPSYVIGLSLLAALAACETTRTQGPTTWGYKPGEAAPAGISEAEAETLTTQYLDLKNQRSTLETALPTINDPAARQRFVQSINTLNQHMAPLEYRLRAAGRPVP